MRNQMSLYMDQYCWGWICMDGGTQQKLQAPEAVVPAVFVAAVAPYLWIVLARRATRSPKRGC
jgi:hypothetical protein